MAYSAQYVLAILGSFFYHLAGFKWLAAPVLRRLWPVFEALPTSKQEYSRSSAMSLIHSAVVGGISCYTFLFSNATLPPDIHWHDCPPVRFANCIVLGYTVADLLLMACYSSIRSRDMVLHHVFAAWLTYIGSVDPVLPYHCCLLIMTEMSSPFVNFRAILLDMGQKSSLLYKLNGIAMMVAFFVCRILPIPPFWSPMVGRVGELYDIGLGLYISFLVIIPLLQCLNIFWFSKICRGIFRVVFRAKIE